MSEHQPNLELTDPWLVAVWPGMGRVALAAGGYLLEKLSAQPLAALHADRHFDVERVRVHKGLVEPGRLPRSQFYGWKNPTGGRDLVIFVGESQPSLQSYEFCHTLLNVAHRFGVRRVLTFASMVTPSHPAQPSSVYAVATGTALLSEVLDLGLGVEALQEGEISGLNGTLLAAAAASGREAMGLLGEVPQIAANVPYLKAAAAVLRVFSRLTGVEVDLRDLDEQAKQVERGLLDLLQRLETVAGSKMLGLKNDADAEPANDEPSLEESFQLPFQAPPEESVEVPPLRRAVDPAVLAQIEALFLRAADDRSHAFELKAELDRQGLFREYEDRFLDLFRPRGPGQPS